MKYTTIDTILSKLHRDLQNENISETDVIEWTGEAMGLLRVPQIQEEVVAFLEVKNFETNLPQYFQHVLQVSRNNNYDSNSTLCPLEVMSEEEDEEVAIGNITDLDGNLLPGYDIAYYRPFFDLQWEYSGWTNSNYYRRNYTPVRLSNSVFFNTVVMEEKDSSLYINSSDEYTVIGDIASKLRFSFQEGSVAVAYLRNRVDTATGYPLIPDNDSYLAAITYYVKWKLAEMYQWNGKKGFDTLAADQERKWLKYCRQAKNNAKMPKTLDEYQNLLEQTHRLVPDHKRYYNYFGNNVRTTY